MAVDWSRLEVEAAVADYLAMLAAELSGNAYSKTEHRQKLRHLLNGRTEGSVEFKHQNISAALIRTGFPYISGYKPRWNYQRPLLDEVVAEQLSSSPALVALAERDAVRSVPIPTVDDILKALTDPPKSTAGKQAREPVSPNRLFATNYLEQEAKNRELGLAGEQFVINFERARLLSIKREVLASQIQHVSKLRGDGDGFDVLSFEDDGAERLIEVKTTKYGRETPFFLSRNELSVSRDRSGQYYLYRVFAFREHPQLFTLKGALSATCILEPTSYIASVA